MAQTCGHAAPIVGRQYSKRNPTKSLRASLVLMFTVLAISILYAGIDSSKQEISPQEVISKASELISTTLLKQLVEAQNGVASATAMSKRASNTLKASKKRLRDVEKQVSDEALRRSSSCKALRAVAKSGTPAELTVRSQYAFSRDHHRDGDPRVKDS